MKKALVFMAPLCLLFTLAGCAKGPVEGTERTYFGTVVDHAMSVVNPGDRRGGRAYIGLTFDGSGGELFWLADKCEGNAKVGDYVELESATEERTGLLIATRITVLKNGN